jgi:hypothetical protein
VALVLSVALRGRRVLLSCTTILIMLVLVVVLRSAIRSIVTRGATVGLLMLWCIAGTPITGLLAISRSSAVASLLGWWRMLVVAATAPVPRLVMARRSWASVACLRVSTWLVMGLTLLAELTWWRRRVVVLTGGAAMRAARWLVGRWWCAAGVGAALGGTVAAVTVVAAAGRLVVLHAVRYTS